MDDSQINLNTLLNVFRNGDKFCGSSENLQNYGENCAQVVRLTARQRHPEIAPRRFTAVERRTRAQFPPQFYKRKYRQVSKGSLKP